MTSSPTANWSAMLNVSLSDGSSHHSGRQMGSRLPTAARESATTAGTSVRRSASAAAVAASASGDRSHGAMENCTAGISALACAHRTCAGFGGFCVGFCGGFRLLGSLPRLRRLRGAGQGSRRASSSLEGWRPKYALPPIMSGRQNG